MLSLLEDLLISKGLVTKEDMVRAFEYQRENEGLLSLSGALTATGAITAEQIKEVMDETPEAPITIEDIDVNPMLLLQLMIKGIHTENLETPSQISEAMKLPNSVINELLEDAVARKFVEVVGQEKNSAGGAYAAMRYQLSQAGRDWAIESLEQSQYFGPAPVTLEAYQDRVLRQRITSERVTRDDIQEALKDLVIPDSFVDDLGPAINSGTALLIYGPAGNGKTAIAEAIGTVFSDVIFIPHCFEVDGQIVKVFDPSVHKPINKEVLDGKAPPSIHREHLDKRWVPCHRPMIITGGELTLEMLDLKFSEVSKFYEAPLHIKAINGIFVVDDFGRQQAAPGDILNRWIMPLSNRVDYLSLHTGKSFQVPFDELVIFSTNMHPDDLMDPAYLRRITYKIETVAPPEELFHQVFVDVAQKERIEFCEETYQQVLKEIRDKDAPLAYFHPSFIVNQVIASCKFAGTDAQFTTENVQRAMRNLFVRRNIKVLDGGRTDQNNSIRPVQQTA